MMYSVKIEMRLALDPDTREAVVVLISRLICRCSIRTGQNKSFTIDNDITSNELRESSDFYILADNIAVLLTYNVENYHFSQYVLLLNDTTEKAMLTMKRTTTLPSLNSGLIVGMGLLNEGFLLATGYTGPEAVHRQVVGHLIAADPLNASTFPNKDITLMIRQFERFLVRHNADLHIFPAGILPEKDGLVFLLKSFEYDLFESKLIGKASFTTAGSRIQCELIPIDNSSILFPQLLCTRHVRQVCHRDGNIWMTIVTSNFEELTTWRWRVYLSVLLYIIKVITLFLRFVLWMRRLDGGVSLYFYMRILRWVYGPSMIPVTAPPPAFNMYGLDMKSLKFKRVPIEPRLCTYENAFVTYPLAIDCDRTGGVITAELGSSLKINYFPSQKTPLSLCKLAEHSVYRNFPAFEKSPLIRRSVGQLNWELL
ncbi:hypothetical protein KIN20_013346 [Parelaphostrongylus tenuis]|uniref:Uncharacterized protein n=1 Tax=Parelaphostrongylus tenuis TaxID=148309 RepID=A0AAD5MXA0_PARTN|nr:hypothetical protein KIN20_013346 [Parelaphostrongylus tenuis]